MVSTPAKNGAGQNKEARPKGKDDGPGDDSSAGRTEIPPVVISAIDKARRGDLHGAAKQLSAFLQRNPRVWRARPVLARVLVAMGQSDQAVDALKKGIGQRQGDSAYHLWLEIGGIRIEQAEQGLSVKRMGNWVEHKAVAPKKEAAYKKRHAKLAYEAYQAALEIKENSIEAAAGMAGALSLLGKHAAAARVWKALMRFVPGNARLYMKYAAALAAAGRGVEAARAYEKALGIDPRLAAAHKALAKHYAKQGQSKKAKLADKKARFYGWLPPFSKIRFSMKWMRTMTELKSKDTSKRRTALTRLLADTSREATEMLAAVSWHHMQHGAGEEAAFEALEKRKAIDLLKQLVANARSVCTIRQALKALTRLRAPGIYELLITLLPRDVRPGVTMGVADCLARLGDKRAVPHLTKVIEHPVPRSAGGGAIGNFNRIAHWMAKERAVAALSHFNTKRAKAALERAAKKPKLEFGALVALYFVTKKTSYLERAEAWIKANPEENISDYLLVDRLEKLDTPEARQLLRTLKRHEKKNEQQGQDDE
jgi:tetratricopeptide (TPR) repeat protein